MTDAPRFDGEPRLPPGTPGDVHDFVAGRTSTVEIDTSELEWLPHPADVPPFATASVRIRPGSAPSSVGLLVTWGRSVPVQSDIGITIEGGALGVAANGLPTDTARALAAWVVSFNDALRADERQLDSLRVRGSILIITSRPAFPQSRTSSTTPAPVALAALSALRRPTPRTRWRDRTQAARMLLATAFVLVFCGGATIVAGVWSYDPLADDPPNAGPEITTGTSSQTTTTTTITTAPDSCVTDTLPDGSCATVGGPSLPPLPPDVTTSSIVDPTVSSVPDPTDPTTTQILCTTDTLPDGSCVTVGGPDPPLLTGKKALPLTTVPDADPPVECFETDLGAPDTDGDGVPDECVDFYVDVAVAGPIPPGSVAPGTLAATGAEGGMPIRLGILLILAGLIALVAAHRRTGDENLSITPEEEP